MVKLDINIEKLSKTAEAMAADNNFSTTKYKFGSDEDNSKWSNYLKTNIDIMDIKNKNTKFILKNSITTLNTNNDITKELNIDPDPRLKMLKYIFKEIYGIEISDSINNYDDAVAEYKLNNDPFIVDLAKEKENNDDKTTSVSGMGTINDESGYEVQFSYSLESKDKANTVVSEYLSSMKSESDIELSTSDNIKNIKNKEAEVDISSLVGTKKSAVVKAAIELS